MRQNNDGLQVLAENAKVQLGDVPVETLFHFRPRKGEPGHEATIIRLVAKTGSPYALKIIDEREDSVFISRTWANIRTAEITAKKLLDQKKVETAKKEASDLWPEYFGYNASVCLGYDQGRQVLVLRDAEDVEIDGLLKATPLVKDTFSSFTVRQSGKSWMRDVLHLDSETKTSYFLLVTITSKQSPIVVFHREIKDGIATMTDYLLADERRIVQRTARVEEEVWIEGEPNSNPTEIIVEENKVDQDTASYDTDLLDQLGLKNGEREKLANSGLSIAELIEMIKLDNGKTAKQRTGIPVGKLREAAKLFDELVPV